MRSITYYWEDEMGSHEKFRQVDPKRGLIVPPTRLGSQLIDPRFQ